MEFDAEREAVGTVPRRPAPAAGAVSASSEALKTAVRKVLLNNRMTQDRMARDAGLSGSALSQWLHGKYQGDVPALEGRLVAWLADTQASALEPLRGGAGLGANAHGNGHRGRAELRPQPPVYCRCVRRRGRGKDHDDQPVRP